MESIFIDYELLWVANAHKGANEYKVAILIKD
jgi:hypothetical protein